MTTAEYPLPAQQHQGAKRKAEGFATPKEDKKPQCARILPKRVLPVIFLPGIMGSNLRMSVQRQQELHRKDNIAWRPDSLGLTNIKKSANNQPRDRQLQLDPLQTTVDIYDPSGPSDLSGDKRHENVKFDKSFHSPLLKNDLPTSKNARTAVQKARERGWGEVFFGSYGKLLQNFEHCLNKTFSEFGVLSPGWKDVIGIDPVLWGADPGTPMKPLTQDELKEVATGCWFPVYAIGYNWLQSNGDSARIAAVRINKIIDDLNQSGYDCKQVIVVTHSMGGLVGRALVHPKYGNLQDKVLGIVHGVMPAIGAPAAYKRMRAGFEDPGVIAGGVESIGAKVAGNYGDEVTAVLANSPGALQLLPTASYGNGWLRVVHNGNNLETWPKHEDPYSEIYKVKGKWYSLFREEWINPSNAKPKEGGGTFKRTCDYLDAAKQFHQTIAATFHFNSYAHYGIDRKRLSFGEVTWEISANCADPTGWEKWPIVSDNRQGRLELVKGDQCNDGQLPFGDELLSESVFATIRSPSTPGDQTVPAKSADYQIESGKFKGIFRQTGYEHQSSCQHPHAISSMLYSIVRIAQNAPPKC